jgi:hypothetical protein
MVASSIIVRGAIQRARAASAKAVSARFGSSTCTIAASARPAQHRLFSSAQPSSADIRCHDPLVVSNEEVKIEETKRRRLSDVS